MMKFRRCKGEYYSGVTDYDGQEVGSTLYVWLPVDQVKLWKVTKIQFRGQEISLRIIDIDTLIVEGYLMPFLENQQGLD